MQYIAKNGKLLRCGYTTGSCAAAAAKAAAELLLCGKAPALVSIDTPAGKKLELEVLDPSLRNETASCAVRKDGGDDPDVTHGLMIYAEVKRCKEGFIIDGGEGIGRVTKHGLDQPVGEAAINSTPRAMIKNEVTQVCEKLCYDAGISVTVFVPNGRAAAEKTFNPRMGIEGGISIVGTTGIVEPMSSKALVDTIKLEISQKAAEGEKNLLLVPGNYGAVFVSQTLLIPQEKAVMCSNFIGDAIDGAVEAGFDNILLTGHIGKLVKLALGVTNTHSSEGDGRIEAIVMAALQCGAELQLLKDISACVTADAAAALLLKNNLLEKTMRNIGNKIFDCLSRRVPSSIQIGYVCFTNEKNLPKILAKSDNAETLISLWRN